MTAAVRVRVPATSANLGPGFDSLALALAWYDELEAHRDPSGSGVEVAIEGEGADAVPRDSTHLVVRAIHAVFDAAHEPLGGLNLLCRNTIPHSRGLGSSAAAVVAGVALGRALLGDEDETLERDELLGLAVGFEGHADNAAAALLGGLTVSWQDDDRWHATRLQPGADVRAVLLVPDAMLATEHARALLPPTVPHTDAAHSAGRAALLVHALTEAPPLLLAATEDRLHQRYRAAGMPSSAALLERLRAHGVAAVISGAGPTVLALGADLDVATLSSIAAERADERWDVRQVGWDRNGVHVG